MKNIISKYLATFTKLFINNKTDGYKMYAFQSSDTWNPYMEPRLAHVLTVFFLTFSLHLIDRQVGLEIIIRAKSSQRCPSKSSFLRTFI